MARINRQLRIAFITSEVRPFSKSGGLADVAHSLPPALVRLGHDVRIITPHYRSLKPFQPLRHHQPLPVELGGRVVDGYFSPRRLPDSGVPTVLIEQNEMFNRPGLYGERGADYPDNASRFSFFCRAALEYLKTSSFAADIVHANDWQSGLTAPLLALAARKDPFFSRTAAVYTIHNLSFLGLFDRAELTWTGLGPEFFTTDRIEFHGRISLAKAGLTDAAKINTVSPTYRDESLTPEFGCGLDGLLRARRRDYQGILNGIDYQAWDPARDPHLTVNYRRDDAAGKAAAKTALQQEFGLPVRADLPLIGYIGRLTEQKGLALLPPVIKEIMARDLQLVFLGTGDPVYHSFLGELRQTMPDKLGLALTFDEGLARRIYAGADFFLMPSRFEPCGLGQMIAMNYGTPPIVTSRGGLADTVIDHADGQGNGFVLPEFSGPALVGTLDRALAVYRAKEELGWLRQNALVADFSWETSARAYEAVYLKALAKEEERWRI